MAKRRRTRATIDGAREAQAIAAVLGGEAKATRTRRRLTQAELGERVGLSQSEISYLETGRGVGAPIATWAAIGVALGRPLAVTFSRDISPEPRDSGHLAAQELVLRLTASHGRTAGFELPTRPANPALSIDVGIRDRRTRTLIVVEIWNRLDDLGAAARGMSRKIAEIQALEASRTEANRVSWCWLLVDTSANRALARRYPAVLRAQFDGSSLAWVRALMHGGAPPERPGIAWIDPRAGRLTELRLATG